jgi:hypothetical protein
MSYTEYMKNRTHLSIGILAVLTLICLSLCGYLLWQSLQIQITSKNSNSPIFSVASSTGETYFTITADGKVGIGSTSANPATALEVAGPVRLTEKSSKPCSPAIEGAIAYNGDNKHFWGCNGRTWNILDN